MNIYQKSGYIDIRKILSLGLPFNFVVGGRATGKTYTTLKTCVEDGTKFMFMRRTQSQADLISKKEFSPFKSINKDNGWNIGVQAVTKYNGAFYDMIEEDGKDKPQGLPIGYTCALSTIANMRGFDASELELLIYDEFIPEKHERPLKNEGMAFLNAYETINRNRELNGKPPLQVIALANSNDLANPIFMELGLVRKADTMQRKRQESSIDRARGVGLFILADSPISAQKSNTALYKLTEGSEFSSMSLSNTFIREDSGIIKSRPLAEYRPIVAVGEICIYKHKGGGALYVSTHKTGSPPTYGAGEVERKRFTRVYSWIWSEYMRNCIEFEEILCEVLLTKYFA